ncbi:hypothetical protein RXV86_07785 [Alisedimentitalea sp. MJ-SS2]|uniref:hypothetical protein n=1 Tax=Aliisedimentitalea sp. MJ-SS2 TaxID=3049795 RepID=UPI0029086960|nr:hypothetical protein [Alisedimentitalea sp. MJ-SS2]MDU8927281.1 hypothetical protein [Alisedimentitalea sp. MJ-SS2]
MKLNPIEKIPLALAFSVVTICFQLVGHSVKAGEDTMEQFDRREPLPIEMQGLWVEVEDSGSELIVDGGEITCFGATVEYDYKIMGKKDGPVVVSLKINDEIKEDEFQKANITELVITPDGEFHVYNLSFSSQFLPAAD